MYLIIEVLCTEPRGHHWKCVRICCFKLLWMWMFDLQEPSKLSQFFLCVGGRGRTEKKTSSERRESREEPRNTVFAECRLANECWVSGMRTRTLDWIWGCGSGWSFGYVLSSLAQRQSDCGPTAHRSCVGKMCGETTGERRDADVLLLLRGRSFITTTISQNHFNTIILVVTVCVCVSWSAEGEIWGSFRVVFLRYWSRESWRRFV